ncbi:MAG: DUF2865 domain-containing protein [Pseudomonadota bacterium]|nr:DUF2865 domain-containing protein [Pseudomonadota bacterium]
MDFESRAASRSRRALAAFLLGAALSAAGVAAFVASGAAARGPFLAGNPTSFNAPAKAPQATYSVFRPDSRVLLGDGEGGDRRVRARITVLDDQSDFSRVSTQGPVCVRLCDGFFFPLSAAASDSGAQTAACNSLCPDAPTEVFYRNGSERIEDAISAKGRRYAALPVSLRYRNATDNTCSCHRDVVAYAPLRDATLRHGDAVMTPAGFMVFNGAEGAAHTPRDFTGLAQARLPSSQRGALQAMERVSLATNHPSLQNWMISQSSPAPKAAAGPQPPVLAGAAAGDDKIRLLVWRGAQD